MVAVTSRYVAILNLRFASDNREMPNCITPDFQAWRHLNNRKDISGFYIQR
jgi:hypothetical protein